MILSDVARVIAAETNQPEGRVKHHARRLQELGFIPRGTGGRIAPEITYDDVALLLLSLLVDEPSPMAARVAVEIADYTFEGSRAGRYVANLLNGADYGIDAMSVHSFSATITVHGGSQQAVIIRHTCTDEPLELAFTKDGIPYHPEHDVEVIRGHSLPGTLLHRVGRALKDVA